MLNGATGAAGGGGPEAASGVNATPAPASAAAAATALANNKRLSQQHLVQPANRHGSLAEKVHGSEVVGHLLVVRAECLPRALPGSGAVQSAGAPSGTSRDC